MARDDDQPVVEQARWVPLGVDVVSTDGFLFDNATLQTRGLLMHKGFPETYDTDHLTRFVKNVRVVTFKDGLLLSDVSPARRRLAREELQEQTA